MVISDAPLRNKTRFWHSVIVNQYLVAVVPTFLFRR